MTFFGSSANDAAFNAWLTDSTDASNRGAAEGINAMMPLCAILVVFGGFMFFDLTLRESWRSIFLIVGSAVTLIGVAGFFLIDEPNTCTPSESGYWKNVVYGFRPRTLRAIPSLYLALGMFVLFNVSIQIFMPYLILYYEFSLQMSNYVLIMAPAIILASVATALWGRVYDKRGFFFSSTISLAALLCGYVLLFLFKGTALVFLGSLLMMCGYLAGMAVFGALIRDYTPENKAGRFQGLRIVGQVLIPGMIGPFIGQKVLEGAEKVIGGDGTESFIPNVNIFVAALLAAILILPLLIPIVNLMKKEK
jgi:MFS family permease